MDSLISTIEDLFEHRSEYSNDVTSEQREAVEEAINLLDQGLERVAVPEAGGWKVNEWLKKAVLL